MNSKFKIVGLVLLALSGTASAQDEISFYDRVTKKDETVRGVIQKESPGTLTIKPSGKQVLREIPVVDVADVLYGAVGGQKLVYQKGVRAEKRADEATSESKRRDELTTALKAYQDLLAAVKDDKVKRHAEFRIARVQARLAELDSAERDATIEKLTAFKKDNPQAWQLASAVELLAGLQMAKKDWEGAQKSYEDLASAEAVTPEIVLNCDLKIAQVLMQAKKFALAQKKLQDLVQKVPPDSPDALKLQLSLALCQSEAGEVGPAAKKIEDIIAKVSDPEVKAFAYNTLGDCHRKANQPKEALWDYLWVDVIYHQNRAEHARALYHISKLFKELNDDTRAKQYREKLEDKQFAGLEYQKMLLTEK